MDDGAWRTMGMAIGAIGPIVVAGALVGIRDSIAMPTCAVLVLVVVLAAVTGGWQAGAVGAGVAALSFDFFHTKPYLSLTIDSRDDTVTAPCSSSSGSPSVCSRAGAMPAAARSSSEIDRIHRVAELRRGERRGRPAQRRTSWKICSISSSAGSRHPESALARHRRTERHRDRHDRASLPR
jgi:hypothetical protein